MNRYLVTATWTPRGGRAVDGLAQVIYDGDDEHDAVEAGNAIHDWRMASTCGGVVLVEREDRSEVVYSSGAAVPWQTLLRDRPINRPTGGYPACECGAPLVPADMVGASVTVGQGELFCVGELRGRPASAADRLRAQGVAAAERRARS